ncbi:MAG: 16S rRNA (adenine(1518)-N(6)/adenine(1519)-N(6))-dimethyltransferase, partial [Dysgonomonas sp.]
RRKTLRNSTKPLLGKECDIFSMPIFDKRPEQLSVAEFEELTNLIQPYLTSRENNNKRE